ncbi:Dabb family protein [Scatolibacter rhodanostii]|uniref:Dabb family protein n=1 Tax=Scatolibacter rhodanostii TaxID=2014781 RepID=UPI00190EF3CB|nr:Dabb family protein [Scatolibacter rhodanostii]
MKRPIRHMVIFNLVCGKDSPDAEIFLKEGENLLSSIPVVRNFEVLQQVSPKNDYDFGFSMTFDCDEDYQTYNEHPTHQGFVSERWNTEVSRFLEMDFIL